VVRLASDAVTSGVGVDAVLWDFRGTLFDDEDEPSWVRNSAASIGRELPEHDIVAILEQLAAVEKHPQVAAGLARCDVSLDVHREANLTWFRAAGIDDELAFAIWARDGHPDATFAFSDAAPVMASLREHGRRMAVVSDIHYDIREHFQRDGLDQFVDAYVLSFEHGMQKPDVAMFTKALDALDVPFDRALMVGDTPANDGGAAKVGIPTYLLPGPFDPGRRGSRGLDAVLRLAGIPA
jgi:HAD superfamily hydrolase (TIGR01549 family)